MNLLSLLYFVLILGAIVLVHEFGHFIFSKLFGVYVYEFSIGMGPKIFHFKKKGGETEYCIRAIPIGGFVSLAGEDADDNSKIPNKRKLYSKPVWQRLIIMIAGATFNFLFAFVILFVSALIYGSISTKPVVANVSEGYPAYTAGIKEGDTIVSINKQRVSSWSEVQLYIQASKGEQLNIVLKDKSGTKREVTLVPDKVEDKEGNVIAEGNNRVLCDLDPTAHAEVTTIREACKKLRTYDLSNYILYTSCEPCPMCLSAIIWANIKEVYYACTRKDAGEIGFRDDAIYEFLETNNKSLLDEKQIDREDCIHLFNEYKKLNGEIY